MSAWHDPGDPNEQPPPSDRDDEQERSPFERPPFDRDPEAQHAPGESDPETGTDQPPMQAGAADENVFDAAGAARQAVGNDNIREGRVGGVMGPKHAAGGQGQGG